MGWQRERKLFQVMWALSNDFGKMVAMYEDKAETLWMPWLLWWHAGFTVMQALL